jgi:NADH:ubiquinone oxidoreductase subunit 4 (subunit M)
MVGVFVALDLILFYVFFEVMLVPMYALIGIWGGPTGATPPSSSSSTPSSAGC